MEKALEGSVSLEGDTSQRLFSEVGYMGMPHAAKPGQGMQLLLRLEVREQAGSQEAGHDLSRNT